MWTLKRRSEVRGGANIIQLHYKGNLRYVLFEVEGQSYLLDRRPSHFIGYLSLPLNWLFYQKVYAITSEERSRLEAKHSKASKFVIPTSLVGGLAVFFNAWTRMHSIDIFEYFYVNFPRVTSCSLVVFGLFLSFILLQLLYFSRRKSIQKVLGKTLVQPFYYKIRPVKSIRLFFKMLTLRIFGIALPVMFALAFIYLKNIAMLLIMVLTMFSFLGLVNGAFSPGEEWEYEIVDIRKSSNN